MNAADQVMFVLHLLMALGPLAVYFLALGLVNSQASPCLIPARTDFALLVVAVLPMVVGPLIWLVERDDGLVVVGAVVLGGIGVLLLRPGGGRTWVVYNVDADRCLTMLQRATHRLGWVPEIDGDAVRIRPAGLTIRLSAVPCLRNVTLHIDAEDQTRSPNNPAADLIEALQRELRLESMLPSATGASLMVIGAALLGVPMWYVFHHMDAIVDVVRSFILA